MKYVFVEDGLGAAEAEFGISKEKVEGIIEHARMFDASEEDSDPDSGSNPGDDGVADLAEGHSSNAVRAELRQLIRDLNVDEQANLVALAWLGRGTYSAGEWAEAVSQAHLAHNNRTAEYLLGLPLLGDYLEIGVAELDAVATANRFGNARSDLRTPV